MLHFGVHEHGASRAEVAGCRCGAGNLGKVLHLVVQVVGEGLYEGAASGGACLVEFHAHHGAILYEDGLHVLSSDVEDEAHVRHQTLRCTVVGDGLDDSLVEAEGGFDEFFAVSRGACSCDGEVAVCCGGLAAQPLESFSDGFNRVSKVEGVEREYNLGALFVEGDDLGGGRSAVDAEHHLHRSLA